AKRRKAKTQMIYKRFLTMSPRAHEYYEALAEKRFNPAAHVHRIVALSEIYSREAVERAMDDAFVFQAFSAEYIANILEQKNRPVEETGVLHLTRASDMLDLEIAQPDMSLYRTPGEEK
ncbi:MAG: IS21 family transposase, partial [Desulfobulbaceae bacterium]|nr:IS21 family transposase [Desulfobulbaceae bacterium]